MTTRLFLHSPSEAPDAATVVGRMPEFERLGERALLLADPGDVVCVARAVDESYLDFLTSLEIGPRREDTVVVDGVRPGSGLSARLLRDPDALDRLTRRLRGAGPLVVSPFFPTADAFALGRALEDRLSRPVRVEGGTAELARELHDKIAARGLAESLGIPVAPGEVVRVASAGNGRGPAEIRTAIERWAGVTGHVIVRGASGASGSSIFTTRSGDVDAMVEEILERTDNALYLVEPLFEARFSPNVEILIEPFVPLAERVGVSEQVLDRSLTYVGSVHPSRAHRQPGMIADALSIAAWMRERRFTGRVGFDFVEHEGTGGAFEHFLTEINPRINGASYPLALLRRLSARAGRLRAPAPEAFRTAWVRVRATAFVELAGLSRPLLYDPTLGEGVIPYSVGGLDSGKVGIACLGREPEAAEALQREFVRLAEVLPERSASADAA